MEALKSPEAAQGGPDRQVGQGADGPGHMPPPIAHIFTHNMLAWLYENGYEDYEIYAAPSGLLTRTELSMIDIDKDTPERHRFETAVREIRKAAMSLIP